MFKKTLIKAEVVILLILTLVGTLNTLAAPTPSSNTHFQSASASSSTNTSTPGALIVVAGRLRENDALQDYIHYVTNNAYHLFLTNGYPHERIYYLATDLTLDANGDDQPDVDALPSDANLEYAITQWAVDKVGPERPLTLYLMDHGDYDLFFLDGVNEQELTPDELDGWLDQVESAVPGVEINVIVEMVDAGSFIDPSQTVSQAGRVVIASTGADSLAYASEDGALFSDAFLDALGPGVDLLTAFESAQGVAQTAHPDQTPWLDDNGDAVANEAEDGQEAVRRILFPTGGEAEPDNGDFETGDFSGWASGGELPQSITSEDKHSGNFAALLGDPMLGNGAEGNIPAGNAYIEQVIQVPSDGIPQLSFWYRYISYDIMIGASTGNLWDSLDVTIDGEDNPPLFRTGNPATVVEASYPRYDSGWQQAVLDFSAYRGQTITLRFAVWNREYDGNGLDYFNTWAYIDDVTVSPSTPSPSPTTTSTPTATPTPTPTPIPTDAYEPNDSCEQAITIPTDGTIQAHTFHQQADSDWVRFEATKGVEYLIEGRVPPNSPADLILQAYAGCEGLPDGQEPPFSVDIRYQFVSPIDGDLHLHLLNGNPTIYGADVEYHLSVRALDETAEHGALVIVAGKYEEEDKLQSNINHVTNQVYQLFRTQGHPSEQIYYLATDLNLDASGDGVSDVDGLANTTNLQTALTEWASDYVGPDRALTLFMMDHGAHDKLYLDGPRGQWVTPQELDQWLNELEAETGAKVNVLIEACSSGSFIDLPQTISKEGRVIVTATDAYAPSYASEQGAIFSDALLSALAQGMNLKAAFDEGVWAVEQLPQLIAQEPWLDSDGNGFPNQPSDYPEAERRGFAISGSFPSDQWSPHIAQAEVRNFTGKTGQIWAEVLDDEQVQQAWAVVYPPSYEPPESSEEIVPEPPRISLLKGQEVDYGAEYSTKWLFSEVGEYQIVIYATDDQGLIARPKELTLQTGWQLYLPAITR